MFGITTIFTALVALAAAAPTTHLESRSNSGSLTWYTEGMGVSATACGTIHQITEHIAALSPEDYGTYANPNDSPVCGKKIRLHTGGKSTVAKVVDRCAGCSKGDVDVMPTVFEALGLETSVGRTQVTWEYV